MGGPEGRTGQRLQGESSDLSGDFWEAQQWRRRAAYNQERAELGSAVLSLPSTPCLEHPDSCSLSQDSLGRETRAEQGVGVS